jgi:hypothetical protein
MDAPEAIEAILLKALSRDLVMGIEDALKSAAERGALVGGALQTGHRANAVGQMRHFHMQEAFAGALEAGGAKPTAVRGNNLIFGQAGMLTIGRLNVASHSWNNARRSKSRKRAVLINKAIEHLVHPDLFMSADEPIRSGLAFFVAVFDRPLDDTGAQALRIEIAVPDTELRLWLYRKPITKFLALYEPAAVTQIDGAIPKLKEGVRKRGTGQ